MSKFDFFRFLFGPDDAQPRSRVIPFEDEFHKKNDMEEILKNFEQDIYCQMHELQEQFEDLMENVGIINFSGVEENKSACLRDEMLKKPDSETSESNQPFCGEFLLPGNRADDHKSSLFSSLFKMPQWNKMKPQNKIDKDLDDQVKDEQDALKLIEQPQQDKHIPRGIMSSHTRFSFSMRDSDGKMQQFKTVQDSDGKEEITETRSIGDQTHTLTIRKDQSGNVTERREDLKNLHQKDLPTFERLWQNTDSAFPRSDKAEEQLVRRTPTDNSGSILWKLFGMNPKPSS